MESGKGEGDGEVDSLESVSRFEGLPRGTEKSSGGRKPGSRRGVDGGGGGSVMALFGCC